MCRWIILLMVSASTDVVVMMVVLDLAYGRSSRSNIIWTRVVSVNRQASTREVVWATTSTNLLLKSCKLLVLLLLHTVSKRAHLLASHSWSLLLRQRSYGSKNLASPRSRLRLGATTTSCVGGDRDGILRANVLLLLRRLLIALLHFFNITSAITINWETTLI